MWKINEILNFMSWLVTFSLQDYKDIAAEVQESTGFFYRVKARPTTLKFSVAPARPPPPSNIPPQSSKARTSSASEARGEARGGKGFPGFHRHKNSGKKGGFV